jgi:hypothetical protein
VQQGRGRKKSQAQVDAEARRAFDMRLEGVRTDQIADALGVSVGTVVNRIKLGGQRVLEPAVEEYRALSAARMDAVLRRLLEDNRTMTPQVAAAIVNVETRRAKLYGLDAPTLVDAQVTVVTAEDIELQAMIRETKAREALLGDTLTHASEDDRGRAQGQGT